MTDSGPETPLDDRWYWDRRTGTAYYPARADGDAVRLVSVWHRDELADARDSGALVPADEISLDRTDTTFDLVDSFRFPDDVAADADPEAGE